MQTTMVRMTCTSDFMTDCLIDPAFGVVTFFTFEEKTAHFV